MLKEQCNIQNRSNAIRGISRDASGSENGDIITSSQNTSHDACTHVHTGQHQSFSENCSQHEIIICASEISNLGEPNYTNTVTTGNSINKLSGTIMSLRRSAVCSSIFSSLFNSSQHSIFEDPGLIDTSQHSDDDQMVAVNRGGENRVYFQESKVSGTIIVQGQFGGETSAEVETIEPTQNLEIKDEIPSLDSSTFGSEEGRSETGTKASKHKGTNEEIPKLNLNTHDYSEEEGPGTGIITSIDKVNREKTNNDEEGSLKNDITALNFKGKRKEMPNFDLTTYDSEGGSLEVDISISNHTHKDAGINHYEFNSSVFESIGKSLVDDVDSREVQIEDSKDSSEVTQNDHRLNLNEENLDDFAIIASEILPVLYPPSKGKPKILIPPSLPEPQIQCMNAVKQNLLSEVMSLLPKEFVCSLCDLPIVGATTLNCVCTGQSFCVACVEDDGKNDSFDTNKNVIKTGPKDGLPFSCPLCHSPCNHTPCHALDVAILKFVMALDQLSTAPDKILQKQDIKDFQIIFFSRLLAWNKEILRREADKDYQRQTLLEEYARYERKVFRECEANMERNSWYEKIIFGVAAAACAFAGVRTFLR